VWISARWQWSRPPATLLGILEKRCSHVGRVSGSLLGRDLCPRSDPAGLRLSAGETVARGNAGSRTDAAHPSAKGLLLREIHHHVTEVGTVDLCIDEAALHQHGVPEHGAPQVCPVEPACIGHNVPEIGIEQISLLQLAAVEDCATKTAAAKVEAFEVGLEELLLLKVAPWRVG